MADPVVCSSMPPLDPSIRFPDRIASSSPSLDDPIFPWLCAIKNSLEDLSGNPSSASAPLDRLLENCINNFENEDRYRNDIRFLKVWVLYADTIQDFGRVFRVLEEKRICLNYSLLYDSYAVFLEAKGKLVEAHQVYLLGIFRNAEPLEHLKKMHSLFLNRLHAMVNVCPHEKIDTKESILLEKSYISPWSMSTIEDLLRKMDPYIMKYKGYHRTAKAYPGKVSLSSLKNLRNKVIELGGKKYQIKGYSGQGGFAQVFKAYMDSNPDDVVALKIQKPAFPWEFHMYRQLDKRIPEEERPSFGFAHKVHIYSDYSILVCEYVAHGTLHDVINSYLVTGQQMEELLCIYYSIEMLRMLETLHGVGIIHGDFKPDNLLVRYARDDLTEDGETLHQSKVLSYPCQSFLIKDDLTEDGFFARTGPWRDQGLCLVDWGRGIDVSLFPDDVQFKGDCRTSGFCCIEMQENRPWKYQVDTYGLCVIVHMMLHGSYMSIEKKTAPGGSPLYQPKSALKRYWNIDLWSSLFTKLLNMSCDDNSVMVLRSLRKSFEDYMSGNPQLLKKLKMSLVKQRASLCA